MGTSAEDLEQARAVEHEALRAVDAAESRVAGARRALSAAPSAETEEAVEQAEREQRRARRFAEARTVARGEAEQAAAAAEREAARRRLEAREDDRADLLRALCRFVDEATDHYARGVALLERAHALVARDAVLVREAGAAATAGGVPYHGRPVEIPAIMHAIGLRIARDWAEPPLPTMGPTTGELQRLADRLADFPMTPPEQRQTVRELIDAWAELYGYTVEDLFRPRPAPSWNSTGSTYAHRHTQAATLLRAIDTLATNGEKS